MVFGITLTKDLILMNKVLSLHSHAGGGGIAMASSEVCTYTIRAREFKTRGHTFICYDYKSPQR